jgi:hypothetical protein
MHVDSVALTNFFYRLITQKLPYDDVHWMVHDAINVYPNAIRSPEILEAARILGERFCEDAIVKAAYEQRRKEGTEELTAQLPNLEVYAGRWSKGRSTGTTE